MVRVLSCSLASLAVVLACSVVLTASGEGPAPLVEGTPLPRLQGDFLSGGEAVLPDAARGKVTLAALGFTYASRFAVEKWGEWFRGQFGGRADVAFYEIPMMGRAARFGRLFIDRGMRNGTPKALHDHVITVYGDTSQWKKRLAYSQRAENDAYLVLLDKGGVVRWLHHGPWDEARAAELQSAVARLAAGS